MRVEVLFFAAARETSGTGRRALELPDGTTVAELMTRLAAETPALRDVLASCRAAVDEEFAVPTATLREGAVVAILPPVSGG